MPGALHQAVPDPWNLVDVLNNPLHSARQPSRRVVKQIQMEYIRGNQQYCKHKNAMQVV